MKYRARAAVAVTVSVALLSGCSTTGAVPAATDPPLGSETLTAPAAKYVIATVGDSHAVAFANGMTQVGGDKYQIVDAAVGGCGIMREVQHKFTTSGDETPHDTDGTCNDWDAKWRTLIERSNPDAVLLTTSFWDANAKKLTATDRYRTISDKKFRDQYEASVEEGIDILSARGARVYLDNSLPYLGVDMPTAEVMSDTVTAIYRDAKKAGKNVGLLDLRGQVCDGLRCPTSIRGTAVLDETGHPAGESLARLSRWILNTVSADLEAAPR